METREIDVRGQICPSSLLTALREINVCKEALRSGDLMLAFITDNRDSIVTIPESVAKMGYSVRVENMLEGYRITVGAEIR